MIEFVEVWRCRTRREAEQRALVLMAAGIACRFRPGQNTIVVCVAAEDAERAHQELLADARENAPAPARRPHPRSAAGLGTHGLEAALAYCAVMVFLFAADARGAFGLDWTAIGAAQAGMMRDGAWWRAVTALGLHTGVEHLISNLAFGVVLALLVAQLLGSGVAWAGIVLAGGLGNALNALFQPAAHTSVGASTAVFGALGLLAGYTQIERPPRWRSGLRRFAPVAAGLMLLAFLGFGGARTDVWAHVAGFAVGGGLGLGLALARRGQPPGQRAQVVGGVLACGIFALAWGAAIAGG